MAEQLDIDLNNLEGLSPWQQLIVMRWAHMQGQIKLLEEQLQRQMPPQVEKDVQRKLFGLKLSAMGVFLDAKQAGVDLSEINAVIPPPVGGQMLADELARFSDEAKPTPRRSTAS